MLYFKKVEIKFANTSSLVGVLQPLYRYLVWLKKKQNTSPKQQPTNQKNPPQQPTTVIQQSLRTGLRYLEAESAVKNYNETPAPVSAKSMKSYLKIIRSFVGCCLLACFPGKTYLPAPQEKFYNGNTWLPGS